MNRILAGMLAVLLTAVFTEGVRAHGPTPQKIEETISIKAPSSKVWDAVKDFGAISRWHTGVAKSEGGAKEAGATRTMTLKTGGELADSLDDYNEGEKSYGYRLAKENIEVFPVSFYSATLTVKPDGDGAIVEWIGRFYRADTGNFPPDNLNDAAATEAMTKFFREGLESLKAKLEGAQ